MDGPIRPKRFELRGKGAQIIYVEGDAASQGAQLSYKGEPVLFDEPQGEVNFRGKDIDLQETHIGRMLTVLLVSTLDGPSVWLSLLLPEINLEATEDSFETLAILTTTSSVGIPRAPGIVKGAFQRYRVLSLRGIASSGDRV